MQISKISYFLGGLLALIIAIILSYIPFVSIIASLIGGAVASYIVLIRNEGKLKEGILIGILAAFLKIAYVLSIIILVEITMYLHPTFYVKFSLFDIVSSMLWSTEFIAGGVIGAILAEVQRRSE